MGFPSPELIRELMREHSAGAGYLGQIADIYSELGSFCDPLLDQTVSPVRESMAERRNNDPLVTLAGRVGKKPEARKAGDRTVVEFSLAVTVSYEKDAPPQWFDVTIWNEGLQSSVIAELYKGANVAVEGFYSIREHEGKKYHKIAAQKVGILEWLSRKSSSSGTASTPPAGMVIPGAAPAASEGDDDWD